MPDAEPLLSEIAVAVLLRWRGRPDARLLAVRDVALPVARERDCSALTGIAELGERGLTERDGAFLRLTAAGRATLSELE